MQAVPDPMRSCTIYMPFQGMSRQTDFSQLEFGIERHSLVNSLLTEGLHMGGFGWIYGKRLL